VSKQGHNKCIYQTTLYLSIVFFESGVKFATVFLGCDVLQLVKFEMVFLGCDVLQLVQFAIVFLGCDILELVKFAMVFLGCNALQLVKFALVFLGCDVSQLVKFAIFFPWMRCFATCQYYNCLFIIQVLRFVDVGVMLEQL
jgi:hypothetical protein